MQMHRTAVNQFAARCLQRESQHRAALEHETWRLDWPGSVSAHTDRECFCLYIVSCKLRQDGHNTAPVLGAQLPAVQLGTRCVTRLD